MPVNTYVGAVIHPIFIMMTKTSSHPLSRRFRSWAIPLLVATLGAGAAQTAQAQIDANFTGGNSTEVVDAWRGMAGDGWGGAWGSAVQSSRGGALSASVVSSSPLEPSGGDYLGVSITSATELIYGQVNRQYTSYGEVDRSKAHSVSFLFRLDSELGSFNRMFFFDSGAAGTTNAESAGTTWIVRVLSSGAVQLYDGAAAFQPAGVSLTQGEVFKMTINISPEAIAADSSYTVQIDNLTTPGAGYTSEALAFYTPATSVGGYLSFSSRVDAGNETRFSLDSIHVIPEPSSFALVGVAAFLALAPRLRKLAR